jgi:hypothetical protein
MRFSAVCFLACGCPALSHAGARGTRFSQSSHTQDDGRIPDFYSWEAFDEFSIQSMHPSPKASTPTVKSQHLQPPTSLVHDDAARTGRPVRALHRHPARHENHASYETGRPTSSVSPHHVAPSSGSEPTPHYDESTTKAPSHIERPANSLAPYLENQRTVEPIQFPLPAPLPGSVVYRPSQLPATLNPEPEPSIGPATTTLSLKPTTARAPSFASGSDDPTEYEIGLPSNSPTLVESVPSPDSEPVPGRAPSIISDRPVTAPSSSSSSDDPPIPVLSEPSIQPEGSLPPTLFKPSNHNVCESSDGKFGSFTGESSTLAYAYELETAAVTKDELLQTILPALEVAITNVLLPVFFDGCYQRRHRLATQIDESTDHRRPRRLRLVGISSLPVDAPLQDMKCKSFTRDDSCSVVRGDLTLHFSDQEEMSSETDLIRKVLRQVMESGTFDEGVHGSIVRVSYVDSSALLENEGRDNSPNAAVTPNSHQSERLGSSLVVGLVLAAAASILIVGLVFAHRRRQHRLRRRAGRGEPVSSGPPSPARESVGPALDPLVDQMTVFTVVKSSTADAAQPVARGDVNNDNTDDEGRSEGSLYLLEGPESGQDDRQLSLAMSPIQFVEGLCVGSGDDGPDVASGDVPIRTILVPDRFGADDQVRKAAANLSSPSDESVYLGSASSKDESQLAMRFT